MPVCLHLCVNGAVTLARYAMARLPPPTPTAAALAPTAFPFTVAIIHSLAPWAPRALVVLRRFCMGGAKGGGGAIETGGGEIGKEGRGGWRKVGGW